MLFPDGRIMVFCKAPEPGKVKTRLAKTIGDEAAVAIHEYLALHCLGKLSEAKIAPIELWCAPDIGHAFFQRCEVEFGVILKKQKGKCLGERMQYAFSKSLPKNQYSIVVGTDCPAISTDYLVSAFSGLENHDSVIGPAEDGGYVLLGLRKPQPQLFTNMPWGTPLVLKETRSRFKGEVKNLSMLWDVDYVNDLRRAHNAADELQLENGFLKFLDGLKY